MFKGIKSPIPLVLSPGHPSWRPDQPAASAQQKAFSSAKAQVLKRDHSICQGCGFQSDLFMEVYQLNNDINDYRLENLKTICSFCNLVFNLTYAEKHQEGILIWLPELSQAQLNHVVRSSFLAIVNAQNIWDDQIDPRTAAPVREARDACESLMNVLKSRAGKLEQIIGTKSPGELAQALLKLSDQDYKNRARSLAGVKLLALQKTREDSEDRFGAQMIYALGPAGAYSTLHPKVWDGLLRKLG
ncbi:hypothetical protein ACQU0X_27115 [Pseudovibrio ascidiaceicola]|uniref:hypothetical protein n=1 Tax=Pseudovibrio ascidiaceicola TaxID=285279 RepID=UPI003D35F61A